LGVSALTCYRNNQGRKKRFQRNPPQSIQQICPKGADVKQASKTLPFRITYDGGLLCLQLSIPVEIIKPAFMEVVGRETTAHFLEMEHRWGKRTMAWQHANIFGQSV